MRDYYKGREMNEIDFNVHHFWKEKWMSCDETMLIDNPWSLAHPDAHANLYSCKKCNRIENATCAYYIKNNSPLKVVQGAGFSSRDLDQTIFDHSGV